MDPARAEKDILIDASPKEVFAALTELDGANHWMNGIVGTEMLTDGDFGKATRLALEMAAMGSGKYATNPKVGMTRLKVAEKMDGDMLERFKGFAGD